jgi:signal transduction histidine kinase
MRARDRALFAVLTPLWLACFAATLLSLDRSVVLVPFYVDPAPAPGSLPVVRGLPPWPLGPGAPRTGDRVLEVGGVSAAGAGRQRLAALAWQHTSNQGALAVALERGGERIDTELRTPAQPKWPLLPVALGFAAMATIGLWVAPRLRLMQVSYPALMSTAFWMAGYFGHEPPALLAAFWVRFAAFTAMLPLYARALRHFPTGDDARVRWSRGWPALLGLNGAAIANTELFGIAPAAWSHHATHVFMAIGAALALAIAGIGYRAHGARVRRRFRWLLLGTWIAYLPALAAVALHAADVHLGETWLATQLATLAVPLAAAIALWRDDLFDVDRALTASVLLAVFGAGGILGLGVAAPAAAAALVRRAGLAADDASLLAMLGCNALLAAAAFGLWRAATRWALSGERDREEAADALAARVSGCTKLRELAALLGDGVPELWRTPEAVVYAAERGALLPVHAHGRAAVPAELSPDWRIALSARTRPLAVPTPAARLLVPVRRGRELALVVALGPKPGADVYTAHDRALLAMLATRAAGVLERLAQGELLEAAQRLNQELLQEKEELGRSSEAKSALLATAGHDLRQPLHALELFLAALEDRIDDAEARALLSRAQGSAHALGETFDGLLDAARLDAGVIRPEPRELALAPLFAELERDARPIAESRGLTLRVRAGALAVRSDPLLLRSVLQNLLGNALRYTERGGVLLGARRRGGEVRIQVWDTGPGIAPEEQARIFRAWERGSARADGGAGLGLALASRMAELLGHPLELRSRPGHGSVFSVTAPAAQEARAAARESVRRLTRGDGSAPLVAIVDDDAEALASLAALLSGWGVQVVRAAGTREILAALRAAPRVPDALVADLHLAAGDSGLETIDRVRSALARPVPAAVISADRSPEAEALVRDSGHLLLRKPVEPARLRAALAHLLG